MSRDLHETLSNTTILETVYVLQVKKTETYDDRELKKKNILIKSQVIVCEGYFASQFTYRLIIMKKNSRSTLMTKSDWSIDPIDLKLLSIYFRFAILECHYGSVYSYNFT